MSGYDHHSDAACDHVDDVGAYLLRALPDADADAFTAHLASCTGCRRELQHLQVVVDTLPIAAPQLSPPAALKDRIMRIVDAEAELLRAAGPEADRVPAPKPRRAWFAGFSLRPVAAGALASVLLAVGVFGGVLVSGDKSQSSRTLSAQVSDPGARVTVALQGGKAALHVKHLPGAPFSRVYQVWLKRGDKIIPTHTLFNVRKDGSAIVPIEESVAGADQILVTDEQNGGSQSPTTAPIITATLT
jgi:hypothetical protein